MSDDVFAVRTTFQDVAELGQGYLERADGERMLLPLPAEVAAGEGVRFIVYLVDGTPAFAGAGRCVQVSDQGTEVAAEDRYETLVDALVFDERSRPVYDYIVAVRQMAYADLGAEAEAADGEEAVLESDEPTTHTEAASPALIAESMRPAAMTAQSDNPHDTISVAPVEETTAIAPPGHYADPEFNTDAMEVPPEGAKSAFGDVTPADHNAGLSFAAEEQERQASVDDVEHFEEPFAAPAAEVEAPAAPRSIMPLATGILQRPAIAAGWQPTPPKRKPPTQGSGLFRYAPGTLPIPAKPPRPDLSPDMRVQPAMRP